MRSYLTFTLLLSLGLQVAAQQTATPPTSPPTNPSVATAPAIGKNPLSPQDVEAITEAQDQAQAKANAEAAAQRRLMLSRNAFLRSVRDFTTWDFAALASNPNWVVAEIIPPVGPKFWHGRSWAARPLQPSLPEVNEPWVEGSTTQMVWEGSVRVLMPLELTSQQLLALGLVPKGRVMQGISPEKSYRYDRSIWIRSDGTATAAPDAFGTEGAEAYSPFRHRPVDAQKRNLAFCAIPDSIQNAEIPNLGSDLQPNPHLAHILSEEMLEWVSPAHQFYRANPDLFATKNVDANRTRLLEMLDDPNPFLFAAAARTLSQSGQMGSHYASKRLLEADRFRQAVFVYSVLYYSPEAEGRIVVGHIQQAIAQAKNNGQLEGLILGANQAYQTRYERLNGFGVHKIVVAAIGSGLIRGASSFLIPPTPSQNPSPVSRIVPPALAFYTPLMRSLSEQQQRFALTTENDKYLAALVARSLVTLRNSKPDPKTPQIQ